MPTSSEATPDAPPADTGKPPRLARNTRALWLALLVALGPALFALSWYPGFVSQDGPAHLYNAQIIAASTEAESAFSTYFVVQWQPLPNWAGHLLYLVNGLVLVPAQAERTALGVTLVALAAAAVGLRLKVSAATGPFTSAALAALLGMNVTWLFGFTGFSLGAALFGLTLAVWWAGRAQFTWERTLALAILLVVGYFCHPVSLGLTVFGLAVLAIGEREKRRTVVRTILAVLPLIPLVLLYKGLTRAGGPMKPEWGHLAHLFSVGDWVTQLGWVDPISLAAKLYRPFGTDRSVLNLATAPVLWLVSGLTILTVITLRSKTESEPERKYWGILAACLLFAGVVGPDTLGKNHGHYLPQRIVLLGLVALLPWLRLDAPGRWAKLGRACVFVALGFQSMFIWDYAQESDRAVGPYMKMGPEVGRKQKIAALLLDYHSRFRPNPMLHADCLLGVGTNHIIWGDYETNHYYFPVQLLHPDTSPTAMPLEGITRLNGEANAHFRREIWTKYLDQYHEQIDFVLLWGTDPEVESVTARFYDRLAVGSDGKTQIWVYKKRAKGR